MITAAQLRLRRIATTLAVCGVFSLQRPAFGAITNTGAVTNPPNTTTGAYSGVLTVGDGAFGSVAATLGSTITGTGGVTVGNGVAGIGQMTLSGFGTDWTISGSTADVTLGDEGVGLIALSNLAQAIIADDTFLGAQATASGKLTVSGLGTLYTSGDDFTAGVRGVGIVEVTAGGGIDSDMLTIGDFAGAQGTATVSGDLSRWTAGDVVVGDEGTGSLVVNDGGRFTSGRTITVGNAAGSVGSVEIVGAGSSASATSLIVGATGRGTFAVRDGGRFAAAMAVNVTQASASVGELIVTGAGSQFSTSGTFGTGTGESRIVVADGGTLSAVNVVLNAPGRVELAGGRIETTQASSTAINIAGTLVGSGTLDAQGVTTTAGSNGRIAANAGDRLLLTGTLTNFNLVDLNGGELEVLGAVTNNGSIDARNGAILRFGGTGLDNNGNTQLAITGGAVDVYGAVDNNANATIAVVGGATAVFHDAVTNSGTIFVSASSEIALLENLSFVPSSTLGVQLAPVPAEGDLTDAFGLVDVGGATTLAGSLSVSLASGFAPTAGDTYEILRASGGLTGTFASASLPALGGGLALQVQYTTDSVVLAVVGGGSGDFNNDGSVDGADFLAWQRGESTTPLSQTDLIAWRSSYGQSSAAINAAAVPEPGACLLAAIALGLCRRGILPDDRARRMRRRPPATDKIKLLP